MGVESTIRTIIKNPGEAPKVIKVPKGLQQMQSLVGGNIEMMRGDAVGLPQAIDVWFNEEGKLIGLPPNLVLRMPGSREIWDVVMGPVFFTTHDDEGDTCSLPDVHDKAVLKFIKDNTHA